jgi:hypothetical protein
MIRSTPIFARRDRARAKLGQLDILGASLIPSIASASIFGNNGPNISNQSLDAIVPMGLNATSMYTFTDGLSNDPRLPSYLQDLTPAQLQAAFNGDDPSLQDMTGCTANADGSLACPQTTLVSCSSPGADPVMCGLTSAGPLGIPTWAWLAGGGLLLLLLAGGRR